MELKQFEKAVKDYKNGTFINAIWKSEVKTLKSCERKITKTSKGLVRLGVEYSHIQGVDYKGGSENWVIYPFLIQGKTELLVRMTKTDNKPMVDYVDENGQHYTKQDLLNLGYISESTFKAHNDNPIFNIKLNNLISLG